LRESLRRAGQRLMAGFEGHEVSPDIRALIRDYGVGNVILFARNVAEPAQVAGLVRELQEVARDAGHDLPLFVAVDQEGGRVARLREPWTVWPPLRAVGRLRSDDHARQMGEAVAKELRACGIRWDLAPVMDVDSNPKNPVIGDRSFGDDPDLVGRLGVAFIRGLEDGGVAACAKHFPGHGDTEVDSHLELPVVGHLRSRIEDVELRPFRAAVGAGVVAGAAVAAVGSNLVIPGLGLVVAGPLAAALAGAGAGAATGGIVGALVGWNIPEERVKTYDEAIRKGGILMGVRPRSDDDAAYVEKSWKENRAQDIYR